MAQDNETPCKATWNLGIFGKLKHFWSCFVRRIHVKVTQNVVKASKLVQMKLKIRVGGILKIVYFCLYASMVASDKGISLKRKILEKSLYLTSRIKRNQWKELTKLIQHDLETIMIGWIVAEIFDLENTLKLLNRHLFYIFVKFKMP